MRTMMKGLLGLLGAVALLLPMAPPAGAITAGVVVFVGQANTPPLAFPNGAPNSGGITFSSTVCAGIVDNVNKPGKAPVAAGLCSFGGSGFVGASSVTGLGAFCGNSGGTVSGTAVDANGWPVNFTATFQTAASVVVVQGTASKSNGQSGPLVAVLVATPVPVVVSLGPPPVLTNTCSSGTATNFTLVGIALFSVR